jgi:hypothetical protein
MTKLPSRSAGSSQSFRVDKAVALLAAVMATAGCVGTRASSTASNTASSTVSDADFGRLSADETRPVDDARANLALARDELGRAKLAVVNDRHEGQLARADQATASADVTRAAAETGMGTDSNEPGQLQQAREDTRSANDSKAVADARLAYAKRLASSRADQVTAAERKVELMQEKVNLAKLQSLDDAGVPAAGKYDHATTMQRVVDAQRAYDRAVASAEASSGQTSTAKTRWEELDRQQQ